MDDNGDDFAGDGRPRELRLLYDISEMLAGGMDLRDALDPALAAIAKHMGMMRGTITIVDRFENETVIEAAYGLSPGQRDKGRYKPDEGVTGTVFRTGKPVVAPRVAKHPLFLNRTGAWDNLRKEDVSFLCVPIKIGAEVVGTLSVDRLRGENDSLEEDAQLLSIIATMLAQAVRARQAGREEQRRLIEENKRLQNALRDRFRSPNMIGNSTAMETVLDLIDQVSKSNATVLICGESGTGKELVAHAIHLNSLRGGGPYVKVNCAALPEGVIESELFGHEKGAFTGAVNLRKGRFELASSGTIFLDEIGYLSLTTQVKLLRVLQEREFERVGGARTLKCDVRVVAATNRNLEELMGSGAFLQDLYYRLNVFPIYIPPLRERGSDIAPLADHFIEKYNKAHGKRVARISTRAIDMMMNYHWPGNVRELENCIERALLVTDEEVLHGHHLPPTLQTAESSGTSHRGTLEEALDSVERDLLADALKSARGNCARAARALGLTERVMGLRVKKHDIEPRRFRVKKR